MWEGVYGPLATLASKTPLGVDIAKEEAPGLEISKRSLFRSVTMRVQYYFKVTIGWLLYMLLYSFSGGLLGSSLDSPTGA